jgi:hypothetical protein
MLILAFITPIQGENWIYIVPILLPSIIFGTLNVLWSVHRAQDMGLSKWTCLALFVPFGNVSFWIALLVTRGHPAE